MRNKAPNYRKADSCATCRGCGLRTIKSEHTYQWTDRKGREHTEHHLKRVTWCCRYDERCSKGKVCDDYENDFEHELDAEWMV